MRLHFHQSMQESRKQARSAAIEIIQALIFLFSQNQAGKVAAVIFPDSEQKKADTQAAQE
ncbi:hypothetical protein DPQ33_11290 [Oceanidesulfovibrio indonesiensis]|uniref:Uncharacterized protein n=1 Tax=Oceanidesulfovibrio indonesiensis TaxID=54767 RepID=A0A7M3MDA5_9BACT|nr:hypothetical protein [Oceanidesulfovibrio indonesiensis]TVM16583.1 hypothetical protein DPQ33_11290 [Oceanidesulfovibrio indonesiensis]